MEESIALEQNNSVTVSVEDSPTEEVSPDAVKITSPDNRSLTLSVLMCPPDGGISSVYTCVLGFAAAMILDGVCLSLILYDSRVGMTEQVSSPMFVLEQLAVIYLFQHLIGRYLSNNTYTHELQHVWVNFKGRIRKNRHFSKI